MNLTQSCKQEKNEKATYSENNTLIVIGDTNKKMGIKWIKGV